MGDMIFLDDAVDVEPKPKAKVMTISGSDAVALDEFVRHVSIRCYDERYERSGAKSRELLMHLERMRDLLDTLIDYPEVDDT
ncbi:MULTISPECIES: hypothetical protein [Rhizobium]|uniref:hypothetical protein n=1 Tax=Rhizobium TaxID=379 RepID=UPI00195A83F6|nr:MULTISPECIES: hypothetical protein [Rhizobium]MBM7046517.1 hypothetical protein [Rhizobium lusitanum]